MRCAFLTILYSLLLHRLAHKKKKRRRMASFFLFMSKPVSRVLSFKTVIYLRRTFLHGSSHLSDIGRTNPPYGILSMLHRVGFTEPRKSPPERWSLTPPFHPYRKNTAVYFCCTFLKVAFTGSYPAPCPVELGLSSLTHSAPATAQLAQSALYINITQKSKDFCFHLIQKLQVQQIFH